MFRKIISLSLVFAIVFSCCSFASAVEVGATGTSFWDWLGHAWYAGVENTLVSLIDRDTCSDSPNMNGRHNFIEQHTTVNGVTGNFYICEYCGKSAGEVLPDAYDDYVDNLTYTSIDSDGGLIWRISCDDLQEVTVNFGGNRFSIPLSGSYESGDLNSNEYMLYERKGTQINGLRLLKTGSKPSYVSLYRISDAIAPVSGTYYMLSNTTVNVRLIPCSSIQS